MQTNSLHLMDTLINAKKQFFDILWDAIARVELLHCNFFGFKKPLSFDRTKG